MKIYSLFDENLGCLSEAMNSPVFLAIKPTPAKREL